MQRHISEILHFVQSDNFNTFLVYEQYWLLVVRQIYFDG